MSVEVITEQTHRFIPFSSIIKEQLHFDIAENVKIITDVRDNNNTLYVVSDVSQSTNYFDLLKQLKSVSFNYKEKYCSREELKKITDLINTTEGDDNQSEIQEKVLGMLEACLKLRGSDVHILVENKYTKIDFRVDGNIRRVPRFEQNSSGGQTLVQTIFNSMCDQRTPANLVYTECCYARFKDEFASRLGLNSIRVTTRPAGGNVLKMVLRLIPRKKEEISSLSATGLTLHEQKIIRRVTSKTAGAIITSGPMGHGKSTLLQLLAEEIARKHPTKHFISVEDPVESQIPGWYQTQLIGGYGETIANLMRMDCNGLLLGEIRESDAANGVIAASQTGNIVLSTIHTDHPIDILLRLRKLGVEEDLLTDATIITCLIGLRLTPLLCNKCRIPYNKNKGNIEEGEQEIIEKYTQVESVYMHNPCGCDECGNSGFYGRTGIFEIIEADNKFMRLYQEKGKFEAWNHWKRNGGVTLCENIIRLINEGRVDPLKAHYGLCNLDRDEYFNE